MRSRVPRSGEVELLHATVGADLDDDPCRWRSDASCQSRVAGALLKCADTAGDRAFAQRQKIGLSTGAVTGAADARGDAASAVGDAHAVRSERRRSRRLCGGKLRPSIAQRCGGVDLAQAFPRPVASRRSRGLVDAVSRARAAGCAASPNDVDALARDCDDVYDDGNGANGTCGAECGDGVVADERGRATTATHRDGDGCSSDVPRRAGLDAARARRASARRAAATASVDAGEACDDGDTDERRRLLRRAARSRADYTCTGTPSVCTRELRQRHRSAARRGVRRRRRGERRRLLERLPGRAAADICTGQPSVCTFVCGNGTFQAGETCDDGDADRRRRLQRRPAASSRAGSAPAQPSHLHADLRRRPAARRRDCATTATRRAATAARSPARPRPASRAAAQPSNCVADLRRRLHPRRRDLRRSATRSGGDGCSGDFCRQEAGWTLRRPAERLHAQLRQRQPRPAGGVRRRQPRSNGDGCSADLPQPKPAMPAAASRASACSTCGNGARSTRRETLRRRQRRQRRRLQRELPERVGLVLPGARAQPAQPLRDRHRRARRTASFTTAASTRRSPATTRRCRPGAAALTINGAPASSVEPGHPHVLAHGAR